MAETPSATQSTTGEESRSTAPRPARSRTMSSGGSASLVTEYGKTTIADGVVAKIASMAAREIPGVQALGGGVSRAIGALMSKIPTAGVAVEVGEKQAAVDLVLVTHYGQSIVDVTDAVRRNVIDRIQSMTGLEVTEVNITVTDLYIEGEEEEPTEPRVQ
jgi:uncharacterized alkaline shock family protein YloU